MFRYRRYRVFLVFAVFAVAALYRFTLVRDWEDATASSIDSLHSLTGQKPKGQSTTDFPPNADPAVLKIEPSPSQTARTSSRTSAFTAHTSSTKDVEESLPKTLAAETTTSFAADEKETESPSTISEASITSSTQAATIHHVDDTVNKFPVKGGEFVLGGQGRHEAPLPLPDKPAIHWSLMPEHFPVPTESLIALPTAKSQQIPKIQGNFKDETPTARTQREEKQKAIKSAFELSWKGYREFAWLHDELSPKSGGYRDPFCGWAATLVDALDTLWIMGLEDEFAVATQAVSEIDFTTSPRSDIPVFETTIRYLGGLLSAHDLSGGRYKVLLEKAQELADVMMGAFDTPNRMPITYYFWKP